MKRLYNTWGELLTPNRSVTISILMISTLLGLINNLSLPIYLLLILSLFVFNFVVVTVCIGNIKNHLFRYSENDIRRHRAEIGLGFGLMLFYIGCVMGVCYITIINLVNDRVVALESFKIGIVWLFIATGVTFGSIVFYLLSLNLIAQSDNLIEK